MRRGERACEVCLVSMPFVPLERPSLALGLLQASASRAGVAARSLYPAFALAERIGAALYSRFLHTAPDQNIGDWLFAGAAFPDEPSRHAGFVDQLDAGVLADSLRVDPGELQEVLRRARAHAEAVVDRTARAIVGAGARIVGCTSVFQQQVASLALLRAVKALDPSIQTMLGGANCEGEMGRAVHRSFTWVDYVVSGEADLLFGELCRSILDRGERLPLPPGVLGPAHRRGSDANGVDPGRARVDDLDTVPIPDFGDYFAALAGSPLRHEIIPALVVETSRGCWWGEKHHCTFCGLNGDEMAYRPKSPERVLEELSQLAETYATPRLLVVDNILHRKHLDTVIPALVEAGAPYSIFYETKANLTGEQIERLAKAGVRRVQPGFESLHRDALKLFDKGTAPVINLQYLKAARRLGTFVTWNFLWQIPGEQWDWYAGIAEWIPLVTHLQPPNTLCAVRFDRFSLYQQRPEAYGLSLSPTRGLEYIYPVDAATRAELAYYFTDSSRPIELALRRLHPGIRHFETEMDRWMNLWDRVRRADPDAPEVPSLEAHPGPDGIVVVDTRPAARGPRVRLAGLEAQVLGLCDLAPSRTVLMNRLRAAGAEPPARRLDEALERLIALGFVLELDGQLLALPTRPQERPYLAVEDYPGGCLIAERRDRARGEWTRVDPDAA